MQMMDILAICSITIIVILQLMLLKSISTPARQVGLKFVAQLGLGSDIDGDA